MRVPQEIIRKINAFMKIHGFSRKSLCFYKLSNSIAYCVELQCPSTLLYVHCYIIPLYLPTSCRYFSYGNRLNEIARADVSVLDVNSAEHEISDWIIRLYESLSNYIFPFFDCMSCPEKLAEYSLSTKCNKEPYFFCPKLLLLKLAYYTYSYKGNRKLAGSTYIALCKEIAEAHYLTESAKAKCIEEINRIEDLILHGNDVLNEFFSITIASVTKSCFNKMS